MKKYVLISFLFIGLLLLVGCTMKKSAPSTTQQDTYTTSSMTPQTGKLYKCPDGSIVDKIDKCYKQSEKPALETQPSVGCIYNNPACGSNYNCDTTKNQCVLKSGCTYNNPACDSDSLCLNNVCVKKHGCAYDNPACAEGKICDVSKIKSGLCVDAPCNSGQISCSGTCTNLVCMFSSDCDDATKSSIDKCINPGACNAYCTNELVTACMNGDDICPKGCNTLNDNNCLPLQLGISANSGELKLTISNPRIEKCNDPSYWGENTDTYYLVFEADAQNIGTTNEYITSSDFKALDPNRNQFGTSWSAYPQVYGGNCVDARNSAFDGGSLLPGVSTNGKVWIEISKTEGYASGRWLIVYEANSYSGEYIIYEAQIN